MLSVVRDDEKLPIASFSIQLHGAEIKYSAQKEGLALYLAILHFAFYLFGRPFTVMTNHKRSAPSRTSPNKPTHLQLGAQDFGFQIYHQV